MENENKNVVEGEVVEEKKLTFEDVKMKAKDFSDKVKVTLMENKELIIPLSVGIVTLGKGIVSVICRRQEQREMRHQTHDIRNVGDRDRKLLGIEMTDSEMAEYKERRDRGEPIYEALNNMKIK